MSINWEVLSIILLTLIVLLALAVVVISYIRHWAARHEMAERKLGEGKYFQLHVNEEAQEQHNKTQASIIDKKRRSIQRLKQVVISVFISALLLGTAISLYVNRDGLANDTVLTEQETNNLLTTHHHWQNLYPENIPDLNKQLTKLRAYGLVGCSHI